MKLQIRLTAGTARIIILVFGVFPPLSLAGRPAASDVLAGQDHGFQLLPVGRVDDAPVVEPLLQLL